MKAAVLCPGPSVQQFTPDGFDVIVGVNRTVGLFACSFWCLLDHYTYDLLPPIGKPTICCHAAIYRGMTQAYPAAKEHPHIPIESIEVEHNLVKWRTWSASCAIIVAFWKGATAIHCWGMDWTGSKDWDGFTHSKHRRSEKRWTCERKLFGEIKDMLEARGCTLIREGQGVAACP